MGTVDLCSKNYVSFSYMYTHIGEMKDLHVFENVYWIILSF